jgi:hypothetical protein
MGALGRLTRPDLSVHASLIASEMQIERKSKRKQKEERTKG